MVKKKRCPIRRRVGTESIKLSHKQDCMTIIAYSPVLSNKKQEGLYGQMDRAGLCTSG